MNEDYRGIGGPYETAVEEIAACKAIVDDGLKPMMQPSMTANAIYEQ
jgi:hypothetical protein